MSTFEDLRTLLDPYFWSINLSLVVPAGAFEVDGYLSIDVNVGEEASDAEVRGRVYAQAEAAIKAAEDAGWLHVEHPAIEITGECVGRRGEPPHLRAEGQLRLVLDPPSQREVRP